MPAERDAGSAPYKLSFTLITGPQSRFDFSKGLWCCDENLSPVHMRCRPNDARPALTPCPRKPSPRTRQLGVSALLLSSLLSLSFGNAGCRKPAETPPPRTTPAASLAPGWVEDRSEEHTSDLQS